MTVSELRKQLDVSARAVRKWISSGKIDAEYVEEEPSRGGDSGRKYIIDPRGLPPEHLETWVQARIDAGELPEPSVDETRAHEWQAAADWRKEEARKRYRFLKSVPSELTTEAKKDAIAQYDEETPEDEQPGGVSMASWYRYKNGYQDDGLVGLMPDPRPSRGTKISETDYQRFRDLYLTRDRRSARECWRRVYGAAEAEGRDVSDFPVAQTFVNQVKKQEGEDVITICRQGKDAFYQKHSSHVRRDWSKVPAGKVWFSDHRLFDVFVLDEETGEVGRPWFTPWMDARSTYILSHDVYLEHPNSDRIHLTFKRAVERYGVPSDVYIDNGKDYRTLDFAGGRNGKEIAPEVDEQKSRNVLDLLGVDATFAKPYNARAKTIERKFRAYIEKLEKFTRGYAGQDAERRPEVTERRRQASTRHPEAAEEMDFLCTLEQFKARVAEWTDRINRTPSDGRVLEGKSPKEIYFAEREKPRHIDPKHLGILCLRTSSERQIRRCEFRDAELEVSYTADWMHEPRVSGTKAFARRDPADPERAWIFNAETGQLMGVAERKPEVHPMAESMGSEEEQEELQKQLAQQQEYVAKLEEKKEAIEERQPDEETLDEWYDAYLDSIEEKRRKDGDYEEPDGPEQVEHEEHELAAKWEEQAEAQQETARDPVPYDPEAIDDDTDEPDTADLKIWPDE
jgi:hypothetical protein